MTPTTAFWLGAIGLALLAWLLLLPARARPRSQDRQQLNLRLRREQLAALDRQLAARSIDAKEHGQAMTEIERGVLEEVGYQSTAAPLAPASSSTRLEGRAAPASSRLVAAVAAGTVVMAFGLYGFLGNPAGWNHAPAVAMLPATPATGAEPSTAAVETMLDTMSARMAEQRDGTVDAAGWAWVARSYAALHRFDSASRAYARALALTPDDAQLLADQADVMSMLQERRMAGEPARLAARALQVDPANLKALALVGSDAFERRDFAAAREHWNRARQLSPSGDFAQGIERNLESLRSAQRTHEDRPTNVPASGAASAPGRLRLAGRLRVAPELAARVAPTDQVFVFAREPGTAGMPIAIARFPASQLPLDFKLDAGNAMVDAARLATVTRLEVGARISRSGDATPRTGDLRGKSAPVAIDQSDLALTIDDVTP